MSKRPYLRRLSELKSEGKFPTKARFVSIQKRVRAQKRESEVTDQLEAKEFNIGEKMNF